MATIGSPENIEGDKGEGGTTTPTPVQVVNRKSGLGPVAKYIAEYGGVRTALRSEEKERDRGDARVSYSFGLDTKDFVYYNNFKGKFPQSVVRYVEFGNPKLKALFLYLQEKEHILQQQLVKSTDKREAIAELRTLESVLIWVATNLGI